MEVSRRLSPDNYEFLRQKYGINENNDERILNNIHKIIDINDTIANNIVLNAIKDYSNNLDMTNQYLKPIKHS